MAASFALAAIGTETNGSIVCPAGAIADGHTTARARSLSMDPRRHLMENDAYPLFESLGDLLITGPTNTNVMDLRLVLVAGG